MDFLEHNTLVPLIEASETYPALEEAISGAKSTVHMAYWTIDPSLPLVSDRKGRDWFDLIAETVDRGVRVRIIVADFDPVLGIDYHGAAWSSYRKFLSLANELNDNARSRLEVFCSRHEARVGTAVRILGQAVIQGHLADAVEELNCVLQESGSEEATRRCGLVPGLWAHIEFDGQGYKSKPLALPSVYPAAHHEKLCVVDDRTIFLGGLDINARRYDDLNHNDELPWHDVACRLTGPAAQLFADHFRTRWNEEQRDFLSFIDDLEPPRGVPPLETPILSKLDPAPKPEGRHTGSAAVAPLRTMSRQAKSSFSRTPAADCTEILEGYASAIGKAERIIYIETQFLRSQTIVDHLTARAEAQSGLELIVLLPVFPDDALVPGEPHLATKKGLHLQALAISRLEESFGSRFGVFTLIRSGPAEPDPLAEPKRTRGNIVYVHAKVMTVDEDLAIIGSANLNDRSMFTDTETAAAWRHGTEVKHFRDRLWKHALGVDASGWQDHYVKRFSDHAIRNASLPSGERTGFIVPMPRDAQDLVAESSLLVPDEVV